MNEMKGPPSSPPLAKPVGLGAVFVAVVALVATMGAVDSDVAFRACLGVLLSLLACGQLWVAGALFKHRHNSLLELSQPVALSLFAASGAVATLGSLTLAWSGGDGVCAVRQPTILLSISFMGSILVARSWRIGCIASPALAFSSARTVTPSGGGGAPPRGITRQMTLDRHELGAVHEGRLKALRMLSAMWGWTRFLRGCGRRRGDRGNRGIRQEIQFEDSMWVAALLTVPQIILQIVNLSVPALRMQSTEIYTDVYACESELGPLMLTLGILLSAIPFLLALLLNVPSEGLPDIFCEFDRIAPSLWVSFRVLLITLPVLAMVENELPSARAYLLTASVLGFVVPLCYNVAFASISACNGRRGKSTTNIRQSITQSNHPRRGSSETDGEDNLELLQMAEKASTVASMYETLNNLPKAIEFGENILSLFKEDGDYASDGFTESEIRRFGPKTLQVVLETLICNAKRFMNLRGTIPSEERETSKQLGVRHCLDAVSIFERAHSKHQMKDRSVLFPGYSLVSVMLKGGVAVSGDEDPIDSEVCFSTSFIRDTQYVVFHYLRALSMKAEVLVKCERYDDALDVVNDTNALYSPALHSQAIADNYGTDHCARTLALSALWLQHLHRDDEARERIDHVIENILPGVAETKELLSLSYVFAIIVQVLRAQGRVALCSELWEKHGFEQPANQPPIAKHFLEALLVLLRSGSVQTSRANIQPTVSIESDVAWALDDEEKIVRWGKTIWSNSVCRDFHSLLAEICLLLAKKPRVTYDQRRQLIERGLCLCNDAEAELKDDKGDVSNPISYNFHVRIQSELLSLCSEVNLSRALIERGLHLCSDVEVAQMAAGDAVAEAEVKERAAS